MAEGWERHRGLLVAVLAGLLLIGLGMLIDRQISQPSLLELEPDSSANEIKAYISGAVQRPGVYTLTEGARVIDAIAAAGASDDADLERVNLARRVRDEDQITVPRRVQEVAGIALTAIAAADGQPAKVNINTAAQAALDALPGVGEVRARSIIDSRNRNGLFFRTEELVERKLIPQSVYDQVKDRITVGP